MTSQTVDRWREQGIAMCGFDLPLMAELLEEVKRVQSDKFAAVQAHLESKDRPNSKRFLRQWLGRWPMYDPHSIWARIARELEPYATAYLGAPAILRFYNLWETKPSAAEPSRSQLWHQDHEDTAIAKAFLYLSDVGEGAGPLVYAPGTHKYGPYAGRHAETFREEGSGWIRSTDAQMAALVPPDEWCVAVGPPGTLVFADTAGYHKGGHATTATRLLATWEWTTAQASEGSHFHRMGPQP